MQIYFLFFIFYNASAAFFFSRDTVPGDRGSFSWGGDEDKSGGNGDESVYVGEGGSDRMLHEYKSGRLKVTNSEEGMRGNLIRS